MKSSDPSSSRKLSDKFEGFPSHMISVTPLGRNSLVTCSDSEEPEEEYGTNWALYKLWGEPLESLFSVFKCDSPHSLSMLAEIEKKEFFKILLSYTQCLFPSSGKTVMESVLVVFEPLLKILVVTRDPVELPDGCVEVEAWSVIFLPEERPGWENRMKFVLRCTPSLGLGFRTSDILLIRGGLKSIYDRNHWTTTRLDLTGEEKRTAPRILCLKRKPVGIARFNEIGGQVKESRDGDVRSSPFYTKLMPDSNNNTASTSDSVISELEPKLEKPTPKPRKLAPLKNLKNTEKVEKDHSGGLRRPNIVEAFLGSFLACISVVIFVILFTQLAKDIIC